MSAFQEAQKRYRPILSGSAAIETRGLPFEQAQVRVALLRYRFRDGFEPREGRVPAARKMPKPKPD